MTEAARKPTRKPTVRGKRGADVGTANLDGARKQASAKKRLTVSKHDWEYARETFISADPPITLKKLSDDLDIPYAYLRQKASEERWTYLRVEEQRRLFKKRREDRARSMLADAMKFDDASIKTATVGQALVMARLSEIAELHQATQPAMRQTIANIKAGIPIQKGDLYSAIRFTELKELALAAKLFQDMGRLAFGVDGNTASLDEATGDGGIENVISVSAELGKDDPRRLAAMLDVFERMGMVSVNLNDDDEDEEDETEVLEGEVVTANNDGTSQPVVKELTQT